MILAEMPAPLVKVTASTLVPSASAPNAARVAVAALAAVAHMARAAAPKTAYFMIPPDCLCPLFRQTKHHTSPCAWARMMRRNKGFIVFKRLFLSHPASVGESYFEHQRVALSFALPLLGAGLTALAHAVIPAV